MAEPSEVRCLEYVAVVAVADVVEAVVLFVAEPAVVIVAVGTAEAFSYEVGAVVASVAVLR